MSAAESSYPVVAHLSSSTSLNTLIDCDSTSNFSGKDSIAVLFNLLPAEVEKSIGMFVLTSAGERAKGIATGAGEATGGGGTFAAAAAVSSRWNCASVKTIFVESGVASAFTAGLPCPERLPAQVDILFEQVFCN